MTDEMIKTMVMRRVCLIYWWRYLSGSALAKLALLAALLGAEAVFVSVIDVIQNTARLGRTMEVPSYLFRAFTGTELTVKIIFVSALLIAAITLRDFGKRIFHIDTLDARLY